MYPTPSISVYFPYQENFPYFRCNNLIYGAIYNLEQTTQTDLGMNLSVILAASSTSLQGLIDVEHPISGKVGPIALNVLCIAGSGERKTSLESQAFKGLKRFMHNDVERLHREEIKFDIAMDEYKKELKCLKRELEEALPEEKEIFIEMLVDHQLTKPLPPRPRLLKFEDVTPQSLQAEMQGSGANALISSSEGGKILNSPLVRNTSFLNDLWSGESTNISRKVEGSLTVDNARLTVSIMTQPSTIERFISSSKDDVRDNGFWSRFLIASPPSRCGERHSNGIEVPTEAIDEFNERVYELLQLLPIKSDKYKRKVVKFSYDAKKVLMDISNDIEASMRKGGRFELAKDHASKLVENITRVAAILHCFEIYNEEDTISEIPTKILWDAINIVAYYSGEFMRLFCAPPKFVTDAEILINWFSQKANSGVRYIRKNYIRQYGPSELRNKESLNSALEYLRYDYRFIEIDVGKIKAIDLHPNIQQDPCRMQYEMSLKSLPYPSY
ncbi:YfjI family protein [Vibrio owensii]|uniref:YfjI family protein n=1 Tax=Vibrio harveyi group TaxID=717610 RepID=UPI0035307431